MFTLLQGPRDTDFRQEDRATVVTLGVECFFLVPSFVVMSSFVMQLFSRNDDVDDICDVDTPEPEDHNPPLQSYNTTLRDGR